MATISMSAYWSDSLGQVIVGNCDGQPYIMDLPGTDGKLVEKMVNQGIDSHLEACFVTARGDNYEWKQDDGIRGRVRGASLRCTISPESLRVLVRRLMTVEESERFDGSEADNAQMLASGICSTLDIELI